MESPAARTIHLRRPPVISIVDEEPFVPEGIALDEVDRRWNALRETNPAYFDGQTCHVLGVHRNGCGGAVIHIKPCAYRFRAVQDERFDLGARALGVKAFTLRDGRVLMGQRSDRVARYQRCWEFAPGGVVEFGRDPAEVITAELREEVGLTLARDPLAIAILYDVVLRCWEIVYRITPAPNEPICNSEYDEVRWCDPRDLPEPLSPIAWMMRAILPVLSEP